MLFAIAVVAFPVSMSCADIVVYSEDFSTTTFALVNGDATVGGQDPAVSDPVPEIQFGQWLGSNGIVDISGGTINFDTPDNSGFDPQVRGGAVALTPGVFTEGAATYKVTFDVTAYTAVGGNGLFRVYAGSDYGTSSTARLVLDVNGSNTNNGLTTTAADGATASLLNSSSFTATGSYEFDFVYDGASAITLVMGSVLGPALSLDNIQISTSNVPEPSSCLILGLGFGMILRRRRR